MREPFEFWFEGPELEILEARPEIIQVGNKLDDDFFAKLEAVGRVQLCPELRSSIKASVVMAVMIGLWSRQKELAMSKRAAQIVKLVQDLKDTISEDSRGLRWGRVPEGHWAEELTRQLENIPSFFADTAVCKPPSDQEVRRVAMEQLLLGLSVDYSNAGGKIAIGGGPFSNFVKCFWDILPKSMRSASPDALLKHARRQVSKLKNPPLMTSTTKSLIDVQRFSDFVTDYFRSLRET